MVRAFASPTSIVALAVLGLAACALRGDGLDRSMESGGDRVATCSTNALPFRGQIGTAITFVCPAFCRESIWGTSVYTDDSSICTAAIHAGYLEPSSSGRVTIIIASGQSSYPASTQNGISSRSFGSWRGSFRFGTPPPPDAGRPDAGRPFTPDAGARTCQTNVHGQTCCLSSSELASLPRVCPAFEAVSCSTFSCALNSSCAAMSTCQCNPGYFSVHCDFPARFCTGSDRCEWPSWFCARCPN